MHEPAYVGLFPGVQNLSFGPLKHHSLIGLAPRPLGTFKGLKKALKTLILTYKYSPYVSNPNPI